MVLFPRFDTHTCDRELMTPIPEGAFSGLSVIESVAASTACVCFSFAIMLFFCELFACATKVEEESSNTTPE